MYLPCLRFHLIINNSLLCSGDLVRWSHLFPFRTESLSADIPMVLLLRESRCRQNKGVNKQKYPYIIRVFLFTKTT